MIVLAFDSRNCLQMATWLLACLIAYVSYVFVLSRLVDIAWFQDISTDFHVGKLAEEMKSASSVEIRGR